MEQNPDRSVPSELADFRDLRDRGDFEIFRPDGRAYEPEEWPLTRSISTGEEVRGEEYFYVLADGTRHTQRCYASPIYDDEGRIVAGMAVYEDVTGQKHADEQLAYYARLKNTHDAFIATDEGMIVTAWNRGAERLYGWTAKEVLGRHVGEFAHSDLSDERVAENLRNLAETGTFHTEMVAYRKDGSPVHVELTNVALRNERGEVSGYLGIHRDITERKWVEEERREGEERFRATFEQAAVGMSHTATDGTLLRVNQKLCDTLGYAREEMLGMKIQDRTHPDDLDKDLDQARRLLAGEIETYSMEKRLFRKDDSVVWINLTISLVRNLSSGEPVYFIAVCEDIDERKRFETEQQRLVDIVQNSSDFIGIADLDWGAVFLNEAGQRLVGLGGIEEVGRTTVLDYFVPEDRAFVRDELFPEVMKNGRWAGERELNLRHFRTGEPIPVIWDCFRIDDAHTGQPISIATVTRDITERKRAEEESAYHARSLENMSDAVLATDEKFVLKAWNKGAEEMYGWSANEVLGRNLLDVIPPEVDDERLAGLVGTLAETGRLRAELTMYRKDGTTIHTEVITVALHGEQNETTGYLSIHRDITERKWAEGEIETRARQQAVVAELGLRALANTDPQYRMDNAVEFVARTLGVEYCKIVDPLPGGEELLVRAGVGWREGLVGGVERADLDPQAGYTLLSGEPVVVDDLAAEKRFGPAPILREHGVVSAVSVVIPGRDRPFGVLGAYAASRRIFSEDDVNFLRAVANVLATAVERAEAEQQLREVREAERGRMARDLHDEALGDLSYALAEAQLVQSMSEEAEPNRRLDRLISALKRTGQQLRGAVYDLRLGAEQDKPFAELLEDLVELHRTMAPDYEVRVENQDEVLSGPLGRTGREILRIVGEALTNTRRHSKANNVRVVVGSNEGWLWAEVSDDGRGFDPAQAPTDDPSTGMGTRGMRERARAVGGNLEIESTPGEGTKVRFELALEKERAEPEETVRVLLVEDHVVVREAIAAAFEREEGFEVVGQAASLAEARAIIGEKTGAVDVALVDLGLPDGDGGDLIRDLREANPDAQTLVLSASLDRAETARAVEDGAAGVLHKTTHLDEVVNAVRRLRAGETLVPLEEVVELLRFAGRKREQEYKVRRAVASLTPRGKEVLRALADGLDSAGIAERLHISVRTTRNHITSILSKLGVHSQLQALVFALRHGVVEIR